MPGTPKRSALLGDLCTFAYEAVWKVNSQTAETVERLEGANLNGRELCWVHESTISEVSLSLFYQLLSKIRLFPL